MDDADRFRLLGTYKTPRVRLGRWVRCTLRGEMEVVGYTDAPIPWPVCKGRNYRALPLYGDLARAVRRESAQAVRHWFGVRSHTAWKWRKALGVDRAAGSEGTHRLRSEHPHEPGVAAGRALAHAMSRDPEWDAPRREKIAQAKRAKPRPRHVIEAIRAANLGRRHTAEARARMSAAHKARGTRPPWLGRPWTPEEDALLRRLPAAEVARRTGRSLAAVYSRRRELGLPDGRRRG